MQNQNIHKMLTNLKNVKETGDGTWTSYCPLHEAGSGVHNNSLSISVTNDGKIIVHCHNGCDTKNIVYATGITWSDCFPAKKKSEPSSKITATYDYRDEDNVLRFQVCRVEPGKDGRSKDFRQRQPDGAGGWTWKTQGLTKFPYRLNELAAAPKEKPVFIVEGEKQVDYLRSLGIVATCNAGGAGKWLKSYAKYFKGRDCIVIPDADLPNEKTGKIVGADHAKTVADSLLEVAQSIHVIELPNCKPKWGFDDWLQAGNTLEDFSKLCEAAKAWGPDSDLITSVPLPGATPEEMADPLLNDRTMLEECGIIYVAQNEKNGKVEIFSTVTQKFSQITAPANLKYEDLVLAGGILIRQKVMRNADDTGDYSMSQIKCAIAAVASQNSVVEDKLGVGVWENNGCLIVVNSRELGVFNGVPEIQITKNPVQFGLAYDIGDRCDWIDLQKLRDDVASVMAKPGQLYLEEVFQAQALFAKWHFSAEGHIFPEVLTGMLMATTMQTLWAWRPQLFLTGQAYAGKSTMLKMVARILGPLCKMSSNSSAAGIRQSIGMSSRVVLCDELEKSRYRQEILEMIRASGRGDDSFRGTAGHQAVAFKLQHIFWCGSIESGLTTEADQSRFIVAELTKVDEKVELPTNDELDALGKKLAIVAICSFRRAKEMAEFLLENKPADVHGRICESYSVPIAMYAAAVGMSDSEGLKLYLTALAAISESEHIDSDSESLLQEILTAKMKVVGGMEKSVIHTIRDRIARTHEEDLEHNGIFVTPGYYLLNRKLILRYLLPIEWKGKRIDTILMRVPGAKRVKQSFGGTQMRFIAIPQKTIDDIGVQSGSEPTFEEQAKNHLAF